MTYNREMEIIESIERKEIFDNCELDILSDIDKLPINGGFHIVEDLEEYEKSQVIPGLPKDVNDQLVESCKRLKAYDQGETESFDKWLKDLKKSVDKK